MFWLSFRNLVFAIPGDRSALNEVTRLFIARYPMLMYSRSWDWYCGVV
jgi:hypothetical protein